MTKFSDTKLALLGDRAAQERVTERGEMLPCPWCKKVPDEDDLIGHWDGYTLYHQCKRVGPMRVNGKTRYKVCLAWNTRPPILTPEQIERLEEMENV